MSVEEHKKVIDISVEQAKNRMPVMAGTACNSTKATIEMTKYAYDAGADAALIVSPFYGLPNQEELYTHFKAVADNVPNSSHALQQPLVLRGRYAAFNSCQTG